MDELTIDRTYRAGDQGPVVRRIQEWLYLNGLALVIDGDFGNATAAAVRRFRVERELGNSATVTRAVFAELAAPMARAIEPIAAEGRSLGAMTVAYAEQHYLQHPREVGGQNRGPWVRLYMNGNEGEAWPWCAGFVCFVLAQACVSLDLPMPIRASVSCDSLAASARANERLIASPAASERTSLPPGSLFLNRRSQDDWNHVGIVTAVDKNVFFSIEGNTNDSGSREGYEVAARVRGWDGKDFIVI